VLDLLIHDLDQVVLLFGTPASVQAKRSGPHDGVVATLAYANGLTVHLEGGWMGPDTPFAMGYKVETDRACFRLNPNQPVQIPVTDAYREELSYFQQCCDEGHEPARCPPEQAAEAVRLALLVQQSRDLGGKEIECAI
jgi:predicted dehydrogenase